MPEGLGVAESRRSKAKQMETFIASLLLTVFTEGCTEPVVRGSRRQGELRCTQLTCSKTSLLTVVKGHTGFIASAK